MAEAIRLSARALESAEFGPFGAVVAKGLEIVGSGFNQVVAKADPTAHAEILAIRNAAISLGSFDLSDCVLYSSCEPCPMCLGAIYWAKIKAVYYACTESDAAQIGFSDKFIYQEFSLQPTMRSIPSLQVDREIAWEVMKKWAATPGRAQY